MNLVRFWQGLSSFGGFIGCTILGIWFFRRENAVVRKANKARKAAGEALLPRQPIWGYADACIYGFTVGWASGRTGCFVAHDHPGSVTEFALGVKGMMNPNTFDSAEKLAWLKSLSDRFPELSQLTVVDRSPRRSGSRWRTTTSASTRSSGPWRCSGSSSCWTSRARPASSWASSSCATGPSASPSTFRHPSTTRYSG